MAEHTLAPWHVEHTPRPGRRDNYAVYPNQAVPFGCRMPVADSISPRDVAIIAAAPELLVALEGLAAAVLQYAPSPEAWPELDAARAVIAKARG